jgi:hypothetical protein
MNRRDFIKAVGLAAFVPGAAGELLKKPLARPTGQLYTKHCSWELDIMYGAKIVHADIIQRMDSVYSTWKTKPHSLAIFEKGEWVFRVL